MIKVEKARGICYYNFYDMFKISVQFHTQIEHEFFLGTVQMIDNQNRAESLFVFKDLLKKVAEMNNNKEIIKPIAYSFEYNSDLKCSPTFIKNIKVLLPIVDDILKDETMNKMTDNFYSNSRYYVGDMMKKFQEEFIKFCFKVINGEYLENKEETTVTD